MMTLTTWKRAYPFIRVAVGKVVMSLLSYRIAAEKYISSLKNELDDSNEGSQEEEPMAVESTEDASKSPVIEGYSLFYAKQVTL